MKGIENIAQRIREDAEKEAGALLEEAEKRASETRAAADREAQELKDSLRREGEAEAQRQYDLLLAAEETETPENLDARNGLPEEAAALLELLRTGEKSFDELAAATGFDAGRLISLLTMLELQLLIRHSADQIYSTR